MHRMQSSLLDSDRKTSAMCTNRVRNTSNIMTADSDSNNYRFECVTKGIRGRINDRVLDKGCGRLPPEMLCTQSQDNEEMTPWYPVIKPFVKWPVLRV